MASVVPQARVRVLRAGHPGPYGEWVLYWMTSTRRLDHNFALQYAIGAARSLTVPLIIAEPLECARASARTHGFAIDGMREHDLRLRNTPAVYYPYVEPSEGAAKDLLNALASRACLVIVDEEPQLTLDDIGPAGGSSHVAIEAVDSSGLVPARLAERAFPTAHGFRRWLHRELPGHLTHPPQAHPLRSARIPRLDVVSAEIARRWPRTPALSLRSPESMLAQLPIDQSIERPPIRGGSTAARRRLRSFVDKRLATYPDRRHPDDDMASGLSPYLRFGHVSAHEVFEAVTLPERWTCDRVDHDAQGRRRGWWRLSDAAEEFLDELVTWRELALNTATKLEGYQDFKSLPAWARQTLEDHAVDHRSHCYSYDEFADSLTHDEIWNAAQRQLRTTGQMHGYLRMLWGKKILEWSGSPEEAFETAISLNNRYALDGGDSNSYAGVGWIFGRYDRAWGPERPIFGKVRYMSSEQARRKLRMQRYLGRFAGQSGDPN